MTRGVLTTGGILKISENSQQNTCVGDSNYFTNIHFAKFLRTSFLRNTSGRLLHNDVFLELKQVSSFRQVFKVKYYYVLFIRQTNKTMKSFYLLFVTDFPLWLEIVKNKH